MDVNVTENRADARQANIVELLDISKRFGGVHALKHVSFNVAAGTVHAIVGENGAGKSTVGKIIGGVYRHDSGTLLIGGREVSFSSPADALRNGVAIMEQEIALAPDRSVIENVLLGTVTSSPMLPIGRQSWGAKFAELLEETGFELNPGTLVGKLSIQEQQVVELLRALAWEANIIVMDEPTAALPREDVERLHNIIRRLSQRGVTVILISHFLDEVLSLCDSVTVMRGGQHVATHPCAQVDQETLISEMLGVELGQMYPDRLPIPTKKEPLLEVISVSDGGVIRDVSLSIRPSEIVGIFGLVGSGRTELLHLIGGASKLRNGEITWRGKSYSPSSPRGALNLGVALLPESRKDDGLFLNLSQKINVMSNVFDELRRFLSIDSKKEKREAWNALASVKVDRIILDLPVGLMSGGNQQKVMLGKVIQSKPDLLLLDEPTRGVDLGARRSIYDSISETVQTGKSVILVSSDLDEILNMSHRIFVMRRGQIVGEKIASETNHDEVLRLAFGAIGRQSH